MMANELSSQPESTMSSTTPLKPSSLLLSEYENILHDRIKELKGMMHPAHNPIYNESLSIEIETLQWVLYQVSQQQIQLTEEQQKRAQSSSSSSSSSAWSRLQYVIEYRIKKVKEKKSKSYLMEDIDRLWIQVETLEWARFLLLRI